MPMYSIVYSIVLAEKKVKKQKKIFVSDFHDLYIKMTAVTGRVRCITQKLILGHFGAILGPFYGQNGHFL